MKEPAPSRRRWSIVVLSLAAVVGLYAVIAGLVAPHYAKRAIADDLGERLGRQVALDELSFNPFTLAGTAKGFRILEADGKTTFVSLDTLDVDGSASSIWRLAPVADGVTLSGLKVNLVRETETRYNLSDILERLAEIGPRPASGRRAEPGSDKQQFSVSNIRVVNSSIAFDDRPKGKKHAVTEIDIAVPFVSNLPMHVKEFVQPRFSAKVDGTPLEVQGESLPFQESLQTQVVLDLQGLEVPPYAAYSPTALPVKVEAAKLDAKLSVRFLQGAKDPSIDVSGTVGLRDLKLSSPQLEDAARVERVEVDLTSLDPLAGLARISSVRVTDVNANGGAWTVASAEVRDINADLRKKEVRVASLTTSNGNLAIRRGADGAIELPIRVADTAVPSTGEVAPSPWTITLDKLALDGYQLALSDAGVKPAVTHRMTVASLQAQDLSTQKGSTSKVAAKVNTEKGGGFDIDATVALDPFAVEAQVDVRRIDLVAFRPYVTYFRTIALKSGNASAKGKLAVKGTGDAMRVTYAGGAEVTRFATYDTGNKEELLDWDAVRLTGMGFDWSAKTPLNLKIADIAVNKAYARVVVSPEGKINLTQLKFATADEPKVSTPSDAPPPARNVRIDRVTFTDSRLDFTDHYIKPHYSADVGGLGGTVTNLSSDPESRAVVDLKGSYDKTSPVVIAGTVNPLSGDLFLDIVAKGKDIELPKLSAYSTRYAGYGIKAGKLNLDVKYHVEDGKLQGRNRIHLDQLTFGDKVEGPDATTLPVIFAVNLLKDSKGQIDLELPINGSLEDPQFDIGGLIMQVVGNLLKKAITSPFSLLAAAFGGGGDGNGSDATASVSGDDLAFVDFAPGAAEIDADDQKKLDAVARALLDRPAIKIEMAPRVDLAKDLDALKRAGLAKKVESAGSLKTLYEREGLAKPAEKGAPPPKELSPAEMEALLLAKILVSEEEMNGLARQRAERVRGYLVEKGNLPAERILMASAPGTAEGGQLGRVDFTLK
jgi:uncharacterized protein involved in outer membrane biogenesis